jgi:hypothetical protein
MLRTLALAAALGLSTLAVASQTSPEAQVNARLDAQLRRTLHRLAIQATHTEIASSSADVRSARPARPSSR